MIRLASRAENEQAWFEARREGFTASDANRLLTTSGRTAILREKITGERPDLSRVRAVQWGAAREAAVMAWVADHFDIPANDAVWAGGNPLHRATPDGLLVEDGKAVAGAEVKCSGHAMDPGEYVAQIQWQMHVFALDRWLLVWEQHDGNYPDPIPLGEPQWMWIERDQDLIDQLIREADNLLAEVAQSTPADLEPTILDEADEIAYYAGEVLAGRDVEAMGKADKEAAWAKLLALLAGRPAEQWVSDQVQVTWSYPAPRQTSVIDLKAMEADKPKLVAQYRALEAKHTIKTAGVSAPKLTITRKGES